MNRSVLERARHGGKGLLVVNVARMARGGGVYTPTTTPIRAPTVRFPFGRHIHCMLPDDCCVHPSISHVGHINDKYFSRLLEYCLPELYMRYGVMPADIPNTFAL